MSKLLAESADYISKLNKPDDKAQSGNKATPATNGNTEEDLPSSPNNNPGDNNKPSSEADIPAPPPPTTYKIEGEASPEMEKNCAGDFDKEIARLKIDWDKTNLQRYNALKETAEDWISHATGIEKYSITFLKHPAGKWRVYNINESPSKDYIEVSGFSLDAEGRSSSLRQVVIAKEKAKALIDADKGDIVEMPPCYLAVIIGEKDIVTFSNISGKAYTFILSDAEMTSIIKSGLVPEMYSTKLIGNYKDPK